MRPSHVGRKVDDAHNAIKDALEARGHHVRSTAGLGDGFPDLLVGARRPTTRFVNGRPIPDFDRVLIALEIKGIRNKRGDLEQLTPAEQKFHSKWTGFPIYVVGDIAQAIRVVEAL